MFVSNYEGKIVCDTSGNPSATLLKGPLGFSLLSVDEGYAGHQPNMDDMNPLLFVGRKCDCSPLPDMYCPNEAPSCHVSPSFDNSTLFNIECIEKQPSYIKYVFPVILLMYTALWAYCFSSLGSRSRRSWRPLLVPWSTARIERMTTAELHRMDREERMREAAANLDLSHHSILKIPVCLKTKKYNLSETTACSICLQDFQQGDRIGDLPCKHPFHVECLKEWIQLKNHCPLCKITNLATQQSENHRDDDV